MNHLSFPKDVTARGIQAVRHLHQLADRYCEPDASSAPAGALGLIVEPIEDRGKRRDIDEQRGKPHDGHR